jgi:hypothetical protein
VAALLAFILKDHLFRIFFYVLLRLYLLVLLLYHPWLQLYWIIPNLLMYLLRLLLYLCCQVRGANCP